jgi:hypothetical protein
MGESTSTIHDLIIHQGIPPDQEITQIVEDLYEMEGASPSGGTGTTSIHSPPWPAYPAKVIYKYPSTNSPDLSDEELSSLCFPHKVSPTRLKRTPSWSNLQQVVFEKQGDREQHGFVFMLKAGEGLPLYGICIHTQEVLHRPPFIAAHHYPACKGPFRQCMISAPRCYCLLSRYPFFALHFRVLGGVLAAERLHRTVMFNRETATLSDLTSKVQSINVDDAPLAAGSTDGKKKEPSQANGHSLKPLERSRSISSATHQRDDPDSHIEQGYFSEGAKEGLSCDEAQPARTARISSTAFRSSQSARRSVSIIQRMKNDAQIVAADNEDPKASTADPSLFLSDGGGLMAQQPSTRRGAIQRISERTLHVLSLNRPPSLAKQRKTGSDPTSGAYIDPPSLQQHPHSNHPLGQPFTSSGQADLRGSRGKSATLGGWISGSSQSSSRPPLPPAFSSSLSSMNQSHDTMSTISNRRSFQGSSGTSSLAPIPLAPIALGMLTPVKEPLASFSAAGRREEGDVQEDTGHDGFEVYRGRKKLELDTEPEAREASPVFYTDLNNPYPSVSFSPPFPLLEVSETPKVSSFKPSLSSILSDHFASAEEGDFPPTDGQDPPHEAPAQLLTAGMESSPTPSPPSPLPTLEVEAEEGGVKAPGGSDHPFVARERNSPSSSNRSSYGGTGLLSPEAILSQIYYQTLVPMPGEEIEVDLVGGVGQVSYLREALQAEGGDEEASFPRLPHEIRSYAQAEQGLSLQGWAVAATVRSLSLSNILAVLNAALLEQRVAAFSPVLSICSSVVLSLVPMLRPFKWQSLMLPVTPQNMTGFLDAPVPYILGLNFKTQDVQKQTTDIVRVNIYKDSVKNTGSLPQIPGLKALKAALQPHYAALRSSSGSQSRGSLYLLSAEELKEAGAFCRVLSLHFANELVGDIRPHVITNVNQGKRTGVLMKTSVEECTPSGNKAFVTAFMETQMFSVWSDEVIRDKIERMM